jgi:hypothetical protein
MKVQKTLFILVLATIFISCRKDDAVIIPYDYRDAVVGIYDGIKIHTAWKDTVVGFNHDTTSVSIRLKKSYDSIVELSFGPTYENVYSSFKYEDGNFSPVMIGHAPSLQIIQDSLIMHHQQGLGPVWDDFFCKKN